MSQRLKFILTGVTAETTCSDEEAAGLADALRAAWADGGRGSITVGASDGGQPMFINPASVQMLQMTEEPGRSNEELNLTRD
jgi:hypothetical protein